MHHNLRQSFTGGADEIEARLSTTSIENPPVVWEMRSNVFEKNLLRSPAADTLTDPERDQLQEYMQDTSEGKAPAITSDTMGQFVAMIRKGETSVLDEAPVLTRSIAVGSQYAVKVSQANVKKIIRTSSMFSLEGFPSDLIFTLPTDADPVPRDSLDLRLHYGWRKSAPEIARTAYIKTAIQQSWTYGLWAEVPYGLPL